MFNNMRASFEHFDHTADMGIRAKAASLPELLEAVAQGLYAAIGDLQVAGESTTITLDLSGSDRANLLRDFLTELLIIFERDHRRLTALEVIKFDARQLQAAVQTKPIDREHSIYHHEVKAITYHELALRTIPGGFEASVIVDI